MDNHGRGVPRNKAKPFDDYIEFTSTESVFSEDSESEEERPAKTFSVQTINRPRFIPLPNPIRNSPLSNPVCSEPLPNPIRNPLLSNPVPNPLRNAPLPNPLRHVPNPLVSPAVRESTSNDCGESTQTRKRRRPNPQIASTSAPVLNLRASISRQSLNDQGEQKISGELAPVGGKKTHWLWTCAWYFPGKNLFGCKYCEDQEWIFNDKFCSTNIRVHVERKHEEVLIKNKIKTKIPVNEIYTSEDLNYDVMKWIASSALPLSTVDNEYFRKIVDNLGGTLLHRTQMTDRILPKLLNSVIEEVIPVYFHFYYYLFPLQVKNDVKREENPYAITSDGWSTSNNKKIHWSATTIHWINNAMELKSRLLDIGDLGASATNETIRELWDYQIEQWELDVNLLQAVVVDGGSNYALASRRAKGYNIWCYCHRLHLVCKDILQSEEASGIQKKCKQLVKFTNKIHQSFLQLKSNLKQSAGTRWGSAYNMFNSLLTNREVIVDQILDLAKIKISLMEWELIEVLSQLLFVMFCAIRTLEAQLHPTLNLVLPTVVKIVSKWKEIRGAKPTYFDLFALAKDRLLERIPVQFLKEDSPYLILACFCDPRYQNFTFLDEVLSAEEIAVVKTFAEKRAGELMSRMIDREESEEEDFLMDDSDQIKSEIFNYRCMNLFNSKKFDVLAWWRALSNNFPCLFKLVQMILCIPASSAPSERVFSKANLVVSKLRGRLTSDRAKALTYISANIADEKTTTNLDW